MCFSSAGTHPALPEDTAVPHVLLRGRAGSQPAQDSSVGSSVEGVRGSRAAREGCRGMQGGTACCHLISFSTPPRKLLPWLCLAHTLAQDMPLEATEFGKNLWQQGSRPQLRFWLAKFIADMGRNTVLSKTTQGKPLSDIAQQK